MSLNIVCLYLSDRDGDRDRDTEDTERELMSWLERGECTVYSMGICRQETVDYRATGPRPARASYFTPNGTLRPLPLRLSQLT